jgi:hypothetical protein
MHCMWHKHQNDVLLFKEGVFVLWSTVECGGYGNELAMQLRHLV